MYDNKLFSSFIKLGAKEVAPQKDNVILTSISNSKFVSVYNYTLCLWNDVIIYPMPTYTHSSRQFSKRREGSPESNYIDFICKVIKLILFDARFVSDRTGNTYNITSRVIVNNFKFAKQTLLQKNRVFSNYGSREGEIVSEIIEKHNVYTLDVTNKNPLYSSIDDNKVINLTYGVFSGQDPVEVLLDYLQDYGQIIPNNEF